MPFPKIPIPRNYLGHPESLAWKGNEGWLKRMNKAKDLSCTCGYDGGAYVLDEMCAKHRILINQTVEHDKRRRRDPLWKVRV